MQSQLYKPHDVGVELGVNSHTIRRWSVDFAAYLSPNANPAKGSSRKFSAQDVETLREVQKLRSEGHTTPQINERLAGVVFPNMLAIQPHQPAQDGQGTAIVLADVQSITAPLAARIEALEAQRLRVDVAIIAVVAFVAGLIIGLAVWWFQ